MSDQTPARSETLAIHAGQTVDPTTKARAVPIYATTSYVFDNADHAARLFGLQEFGNIYTRIMNPTTDVFEQRIAALEGGVAALGVASGQAAETLTILNLARAGDNIVTSSSLYGGTYNLFQYTLPKYGIDFKFVDGSRARGVREGDRRQDEGRLPRDDRQPAPGRAGLRGHREDRPQARRAGRRGQHLRAAPLPAVRASARTSSSTPPPSGSAATEPPSAAWSWTAASSTGRPRRASRPTSWTRIRPTTASATPAPSATSAFILKAPRPGPARPRRGPQPVQLVPLPAGPRDPAAAHRAPQLQRPGGGEVAREEPGRRRGSATPAWPRIPRNGLASKYLTGGFGGVVTFGLKGGVEAGRKLIDSVKLFSLLANVGDAKSLIIHPASTTHQQLSADDQVASGVTPELVRISVGHRARRRHHRRPRSGHRRGEWSRNGVHRRGRREVAK